MMRRHLLAAGAALLLAGCSTPALELSGLAELPPLDYAVLVTGGAFVDAAAGGAGTFVTAPAAGAPRQPGPVEPLRIEDVLAVLQAGAVFHRAVGDDDGHRREILQQIDAQGGRDDLAPFLRDARAAGFDLLLVIEGLQDAPIEAQGINGRWPVTLATWLLLGVGVFIPDHTFETRAQLQVSVRDLQTGAELYELPLFAGPVELSLVERGNFWGLLLSIIVPPFWVHDDTENVLAGVRDVTARRLLLQLARTLKSEAVRQTLRQRSQVAFAVDGRRLVVESTRSLSALRLRPEAAALPADVAAAFERAILAGGERQDDRFVYSAALPRELPDGLVQVLGGTITGEVASATLRIGEAP